MNERFRQENASNLTHNIFMTFSTRKFMKIVIEILVSNLIQFQDEIVHFFTFKRDNSQSKVLNIVIFFHNE